MLIILAIQVQYFEPAKWVKLRELKTDDNLLFL